MESNIYIYIYVLGSPYSEYLHTHRIYVYYCKYIYIYILKKLVLHGNLIHWDKRTYHAYAIMIRYFTGI